MANRPNNEKRQQDLPNFKVNPEYEGLFSRLSQDAYNELKESIRVNGQYVPIVVNSNYVLLDGHNRLKACRELGAVPKFEIKKFAAQEEEVEFVIRVNLERRHMSAFQRIQKAYLLEDIEKKKARARQIVHLRQGNKLPSVQNDNNGEDENGRVIERCAKAADVSPTTYMKARYIIKHGTFEQNSMMENRESSIDKMYQELKEANGTVEDSPPFQGRVEQVSKDIKLIYGDFRAVSKHEIAADSIKLIIPSRVPSENRMETIAYLARFAENALKPGGFLVLQTDFLHLCEVNDIIARNTESLKLFWLLIVKANPPHGAMFPVQSNLELHILFHKIPIPMLSDRKFVDFMDLTDYEPSYEIPEKIVEQLIISLSSENETVCDPMSAYGFVARSATKMKRQYIGIEMNWQSFDAALRLLRL
jgi:hypothetical protein